MSAAGSNPAPSAGGRPADDAPAGRPSHRAGDRSPDGRGAYPHRMRRVLVLFLGGTISMTGGNGEPGLGLRPALAGAELFRALPLPADVQVEAVDVARVDSSALTFATCLDALARADAAVRRDGCDGVVVVQGTDTLEETAYLWDLLWPHPQPFVVTGAMRPADVPGADGPGNLLAAVTLAASEQGRDAGVLVVIGDEIHAARYVAKRHSSSSSAFTSPDFGPLGRMSEGRPAVVAGTPRHDVLPVPARVARVALVRATLDDDPELYRAAAALSDGLVVEGLGAGQVRPEVAEVLVELVRDRPVVLSSRTGAGTVATRTYAGPGSGSDLVARGLVPSGRLDGAKARVLLSLLLPGVHPPAHDAVAAAFAHHGG